MTDLENTYTTGSQEDFFKDAKFGDKFIDNEGKTYIYHYMEKYKASDGKIWDYHYLIREPAVYNDYPALGEIKYHPYEAYVFKDGFGIPSHLKYYSVESMKDGPNNDYFIIRKLNNE